MTTLPRSVWQPLHESLLSAVLALGEAMPLLIGPFFFSLSQLKHVVDEYGRVPQLT